MDRVPVGDSGGRRRSRSAPSAGDAASAFGAILDALSRVISSALIDDAGWASLRDAVRGLPVDPGTGFGFELRLADAAAGTDFYIALPRGSSLGDYYIRLGECASPGSAAAVLGDQLASIDARAPWSDILCVEFDAASGPLGAPPGLFIRIGSDLAENGAVGAPDARTVAEWLTGAVGWRLAAGEGRALRRAFDAVAGAGSSVDCLGIMPGRTRRAFKVNSRAMESERVLMVLEGLGWSGPAGEVAAFLARFEGLFHSLRLAIGVTADGVLPRIGLELFQGEPGSLSQPGAGEWPPFLAGLCENGLCLPQKLDGLLAWPGRELVFRGRDTFGVLTGIAHVKVSFEERDGGAAIEAKAYPAAGYLPFETIESRFALR